MENRDFTRVSMSTCGDIAYQDQTFEGWIENVSLRGLFIRTSQQLPLETLLEVSVHYDKDRTLDFRATVVRRSKHGLGLKINRMDMRTLAFIKNLLVDYSGDQERVLNETRKMVQQMI